MHVGADAEFSLSDETPFAVLTDFGVLFHTTTALTGKVGRPTTAAGNAGFLELSDHPVITGFHGRRRWWGRLAGAIGGWASQRTFPGALRCSRRVRARKPLAKLRFACVLGVESALDARRTGISKISAQCLRAVQR